MYHEIFCIEKSPGGATNYFRWLMDKNHLPKKVVKESRIALIRVVLEIIFNRPAKITFNMPYATIWFFVIWAARMMGVRCDGVVPGYFISKYPFLVPIKKAMYSMSLRRFSHITCCCEDTRNEILSKFPQLKKEDTDVVYYEPPAIPERIFVAGFVGRIVQDKGIMEFVRAINELSRTYPDLYGMVIGDGDMLEEAKKAACGNIEFCGWVKQTHVFLRQFDVLVSPSYHEGLPLILFDAIQLKIPVIMTDVGGIREKIQDAVSYRYINVGDVEDLSKAIEAQYLTVKKPA